jgi:hypothetical protein
MAIPFRQGRSQPVHLRLDRIGDVERVCLRLLNHTEGDGRPPVKSTDGSFILRASLRFTECPAAGRDLPHRCE